MIEEIINTKVKAFIVFVFSALSLGLFLLSTQFAVLVFTKWYGMIAGAVLMVIAIPFHIGARKIKGLYLVSIALNSIANGFSVSTYYIQRGILVNLVELFFSLAPAIGVLFLVYASLQIYSKTKRFAISISVVLVFLLIIGEVAFWIKTGSIIFSFGFFGLIIALFFICVFGVTINHDERFVLRDISFGCFGSFVILTVVVILILSEGDILDGIFDGAGFSGGGKSKKQKRNTNF